MKTTKMMPIFSMRLAGYLMLSGFVIMDMRANELYPERKVFYFVDSAELQEKIHKYEKGRIQTNDRATLKRNYHGSGVATMG